MHIMILLFSFLLLLLLLLLLKSNYFFFNFFLLINNNIYKISARKPLILANIYKYIILPVIETKIFNDNKILPCPPCYTL